MRDWIQHEDNLLSFCRSGHFLMIYDSIVCSEDTDQHDILMITNHYDPETVGSMFNLSLVSTATVRQLALVWIHSCRSSTSSYKFKVQHQTVCAPNNLPNTLYTIPNPNDTEWYRWKSYRFQIGLITILLLLMLRRLRPYELTMAHRAFGGVVCVDVLKTE